MHKCIIIDDEPHAIDGLKNYISLIPDLELVKSYTDPLQALMEISVTDKVDLMLLDIDMPQISGIELSKEIRKKNKQADIYNSAY